MSGRRAGRPLGDQEDAGARQEAGAEGAADDGPLEQAVADHDPDRPDDQLEEQCERTEEAEQRVRRCRRKPSCQGAPGEPEQPPEPTGDPWIAPHTPWEQEHDEELADHHQDQRDPEDARHGAHEGSLVRCYELKTVSRLGRTYTIRPRSSSSASASSCVSCARRCWPSSRTSSARTSNPRWTTRSTIASRVSPSGSSRRVRSRGRTNASPIRLTAPTKLITNSFAGAS